MSKDHILQIAEETFGEKSMPCRLERRIIGWEDIR
jgi:hypothetical protein